MLGDKPLIDHTYIHTQTKNEYKVVELGKIKCPESVIGTMQYSMFVPIILRDFMEELFKVLCLILKILKI